MNKSKAKGTKAENSLIALFEDIAVEATRTPPGALHDVRVQLDWEDGWTVRALAVKMPYRSWAFVVPQEDFLRLLKYRPSRLLLESKLRKTSWIHGVLERKFGIR